jgi:chemosensory pili system protein ChpA (sensor histidine kinase/response regulator)
MSVNLSPSAVDLGPLSWVKTEIEHSLAEARTNLDKLSNDSADAKALKAVVTHLHQVTGALSMVGLGAAARFSEEIEAIVTSLEEAGAKALVKERVSLAKQGTGALSGYLDSLMAGEPDRPMALSEAYLALRRGRGISDASESDLFAPDLTVILPAPDDTVALPRSDMMSDAVRQRRSLYQSGLLKLLREKDFAGGARDMRNAALAIEALQVTSPTRAFWFTVTGFFEAVSEKPAESGGLAVQLFGKIDQQIKLLIEGVQKVPERLFRDLLLVIGKSSAKSERIRDIRALYRLDELLAAAPVRDALADESERALVRSLRDQIQAAKDNWLKFTSGNRSALEAFAQQGEALVRNVQPLSNAAMAEILRVIGLVGPHLRKTGLPASEVQALEIASAMLFVESSLENYFRLTAEFSAQTQAIVARIKGAMSGTVLPPLDPSTNAMMDDFTKRAQERLLIFQVGQEVQVNLSTIESTLDTFFRDPSRVAELATLLPLFSQVQGALAILELNEAAALNQMLRDRVVQFSSGAVRGEGDDAEAVAEGVSALGLYVSALQQHAADPRASLLPALIRFGLAAKPAEAERSLLKAPVSPADVDVDKQIVQARYEEWKQQPQDEANREHLQDAVKALKQNAEITGDYEAVKRSDATLQALDTSTDPLKAGVADALAEIAPTKPAELPASQVIHLLDAPTTEVDQELLEIFLEEATEVVATIVEHAALARQSPHDREALSTIRRGFHTLKGSGRMVGLMDLGEVAWSCEQAMNKWLKDEQPASESLLRLIDDAANAFGGWVGELQNSGSAKIDGTHLQRLADQLKSDRAADVAAEAAPASVESAATDAQAIAFDTPQQPHHLDEPSADSPVAVDSALGLPTVLSEPVVGGAEVSLPMVDLDAVFAELPAIEPALPVSANPMNPPAIEMPAIDEPVAAEAAELELASEPEPEAETEVGPVRLPQPLFDIYIGEASGHVETLDREMAKIEANPHLSTSYEFMRAAHTLSSSSRTTGFESVASLAFALEKWLQDAIEHVTVWESERIAQTRQAVAALINMVSQLHDRQYPPPAEELVAGLTALRKSLTSAAAVVDDIGAFVQEDSDQFEPKATFDIADALDAPAEVIGTVAIEPTTVFEIGSTSALVAAAAAFAATPEPEGVVQARAEGEAPSEATQSAPSAELAFPALSTGVSLPPVPDEPSAVAAAAAEVPAEASAPAFESGKDRRALVDDVDADLLPIFLEEAREIVPQVGDALRRWRAAPVDHSPVPELARHLHTLKGSARMAGLMRLGELAHVMETRIIEMERNSAPPSVDFDAVDDRLDRFNGALESLQSGDLAPVIEIPVEASVAAAISSELPAPMAAIVAARAEIVAEGERLEGRERQALLRVNADLIDRFVNEAGELAIARSRVDLELQAFKKALLELSDNVTRMKVQLREIEIGAETQIQSRLKDAETTGEQFDPLEFDRFSRMQELARFMAESLNDVVTLQQSLGKNLDEADAALLQQSRLNRDLQQGLMGVRLVPLGNLQDRFYRLVRQTAKELDKKANLEFRGVRVEIDRSVLEKITAPFEHLLRNAVAHGIETPGARLAAGKAEIGEITIDARQIGNEVLLTLSDDGAGLNYARIRAKAIERGMMAADAITTEAQLAQMIFAAGFSTAEEVSQLAGRGVGMDVVRSEIVSLGGRIEIASVTGRGITFTIALPLTLAVTQAVLVLVGETTYAIPSGMIEQVQEFKGKRYEPLLELNEIEWKGNRYPLRSMELMLGGRPKVSAQRRAFVILAKSGQLRAAVQVDDVLGNREIVVKPIGPQLARIPGIAGATVLGSGQVVLIMNPVQLVFRELRAPTAASVQDGAAAAVVNVEPLVSTEVTAPTVPSGPTLAQAFAAEAGDVGGFMAAEPVLMARAAPLVMVVDDSLTVRKITSRMLTREGFEVVTAKDGVDGLQQLQDIAPDMILLDIEMPRMDGFEFARNVRADARTQKIPIVMITSRTADKHRNRALELGVNEYMGKPYQEEQLLQMIRQYTTKKMAA